MPTSSSTRAMLITVEIQAPVMRRRMVLFSRFSMRSSPNFAPKLVKCPDFQKKSLSLFTLNNYR